MQDQKELQDIYSKNKKELEFLDQEELQDIYSKIKEELESLDIFITSDKIHTTDKKVSDDFDKILNTAKSMIAALNTESEKYSSNKITEENYRSFLEFYQKLLNNLKYNLCKLEDKVPEILSDKNAFNKQRKNIYDIIDLESKTNTNLDIAFFKGICKILIENTEKRDDCKKLIDQIKTLTFNDDTFEHSLYSKGGGMEIIKGIIEEFYQIKCGKKDSDATTLYDKVKIINTLIDISTKDMKFAAAFYTPPTKWMMLKESFRNIIANIKKLFSPQPPAAVPKNLNPSLSTSLEEKTQVSSEQEKAPTREVSSESLTLPPQEAPSTSSISQLSTLAGTPPSGKTPTSPETQPPMSRS